MERGKYDSEICDVGNLNEGIKQLIIRLSENMEVKKDGIPLVVQKYIIPDIKGHLSNERRIAKENRDFIYEYESNMLMGIETETIHLRNWRKKYDLTNYEKNQLAIKEMDEALRIVSAYYYYKKKRVHVEFVYSKSVLYLVQCDYASENCDAINPEKYNIEVDYDRNFCPEILRCITPEDKGKYKKIDNVIIYQEVGEKMPALYILDNKKIFDNLIKGIIPDKLKRDLKELLKGSLIIRTNVESEDIRESQLSKRSNEVRSYEEAISFLKEACIELRECKIKEYVFIFHNFIPAKAAAFVNAQPMNEFVEIQALWGLPEGLYYNSHDVIKVDTRAINVEKMSKSEFDIELHPVYKEHYIAPDENGAWVMKKLTAPYDWKCTITSNEIIRDIAYRSRKIAEYLNEEVSIMWFVGIDQSYYGTHSLPWYHETYDSYSFLSYKKIKYKKKYFYEKDVTVVDEKDIEKIKQLDQAEIGIVKIQPIDDKLLRSKKFIGEIASICKEKNVNILLEGASLAHLFYQLASTGVNVLTTYDFKAPGETVEFNKLVRDRIPEIIKKNGENINTVKIIGGGLKKAIKNKLIEEAYEVFDAFDRTEIIEELADLEEACRALEHNENAPELFLRNSNYAINDFLCGFDIAIPLGQKQSLVSRIEKLYVYGTMERIKSNIQVIFIFGKEDLLQEERSVEKCDDLEKLTILNASLKIAKTSSISENKLLIGKIRKASSEIRKREAFADEDFEKIRANKKEKKGGFDKGYILLKTFRGYNEDRNLLTDVDLGEPNRIYELKEMDYIDVDYINYDRLLIRLKFPIYNDRSEWIIVRNKVNEYFGRNVKLKIKKQIDETSILFGIEIIEQEGEQLEWVF